MTGFKPRIYGIGGYQLSHNHCVKWVNFDHLFKKLAIRGLFFIFFYSKVFTKFDEGEI